MIHIACLHPTHSVSGTVMHMGCPKSMVHLTTRAVEVELEMSQKLRIWNNLETMQKHYSYSASAAFDLCLIISL